MLGKKSLKTLFATLFLAISTTTNANDTTPVGSVSQSVSEASLP